MIILTILNTLAILYLILCKTSKYYFQFRKETTTFNETLLGYRLVLWRKTSANSASSVWQLYLPIRDRNKTENIEEANRMISKYSQQNIIQSLTAKFSWLRTWEEVREFEKYYSVVDKKTVERLVDNFVPKS